MKLEKGTKVKIIKYGHQVTSADGKKKDMMPQLVGKTGKISEVMQSGYMIKMDDDGSNMGWFEDEQIEEIK